jgi:nucleoside-diphosphate-sugar epimerase
MVARLSTAHGVGKVLALDAVPASSQAAEPARAAADVTWRTVDITDPALASTLDGVDVVVHRVVLEGDAGASAQLAAETVLTAAAAVGVARAVIITSASVYGAQADNPVPLDEAAPLRAVADGSGPGRLLEVEALVARCRAAHPGLDVTVLRPATLVASGEPSLVSRHFDAARLLVVRGSSPRWQFLHVDDLASAVELAVSGRVTGDVTLGCDGSLSQEQVEALSGRRRVELPGALAMGTAERLHRLGVTSAPASELAYVSQPWVVPSTALRAAGWSPTWDNEACFELLLETIPGGNGLQRIGGRLGARVGGKEAALGATGATVAVLGTAAVVRQIRRHRRSF